VLLGRCPFLKVFSLFPIGPWSYDVAMQIMVEFKLCLGIEDFNLLRQLMDDVMGTLSFSKKDVLKPVINEFRIGILLEGSSSELLDRGFPRRLFHCLLTLLADDVLAADGTADLR
jgi:hypothetical protein